MKYEPIGEIIRKKFEESGMKMKEFASKINRERTSVYYLFKKESIEIEVLEKISEALNYDFIYEVYKYKKQDDNDNSTSPTQTVCIAVEIDIEKLQNLNLPDDFIRLVKKQK